MCGGEFGSGKEDKLGDEDLVVRVHTRYSVERGHPHRHIVLYQSTPPEKRSSPSKLPDMY
jgi:hypothetical protein